jgi:hypothetical protein
MSFLSAKKSDISPLDDEIELTNDISTQLPLLMSHKNHSSNSLPNTVHHQHYQNDLHSSPSQLKKVSVAIFYGISSILVIFTNKAVMTYYKFHFFDFLALVQFLCTTTILLMLIITKKVDTIPMINWSICKEILPVSLMFLGNVLCGLGSTKSLNIPMFTALRRFSIMMTMLGEWYLLGTKPSYSVVGSILLMVLGALIAAFYDLTYDFYGYCFVFLNNIFTAFNGVYMKKATVSGKVSKMGVLFYNSLFSAIILSTYFMLEHYYYNQDMLQMIFVGGGENQLTGGSTLAGGTAARRLLSNVLHFADGGRNFLSSPHQVLHSPPPVLTSSSSSPSPMSSIISAAAFGAVSSSGASSASTAALSTFSKVYNFEHWNNSSFLATFVLAASMGAVLNYSIFLCTTINSPLTTAVVGALKNIVTTYIGMIAFNDYTFTLVNFFGINLSVCGSLYYTYMILFKGATGFGNT